MSENKNPDINEIYNQEADIHRPIPELEPNELHKEVGRLSKPLGNRKKPENPQPRPQYPHDDIAPRLSE